MPQIIFNPSRYRIFSDAATTPPFLPSDEAQQAITEISAAPDQAQFSVDDIPSIGIPSNVTTAPSKKRQVLSALARGLQAGADAASVPNIAAGGGTDVMRGLSYALDRQYQRDAASDELARRNRLEAAQADENRAQAEWYRRRADAASTGVWINDGNGMQHNTVTGEQRSVGGTNAAEARLKADRARLEERKNALIAAGIDPNSREGFAALYGMAGSVLPKTGSTTGAQGQRVFYRMGADGIPVFTQEVAAPPKMGTVRGPNGETQFTEQRPGQGGTVINSTPGVPPRTAAPASSGRTASPAAAHSQAVNQFVNRLLSDAQQRGISTKFAIEAAENPQYYTDVPPAVKMDAVVRIKRAQATGAPKASAGGGGVRAEIAGQPATVRLQAPDGTIKEVPASQAAYYIQLGAKRL